MPFGKILWFDSLGFKGTIMLVAIACGLLIGAVWVVNTTGEKEVLNETTKLIEQTGNNAVESLRGRAAEVAALVRTIATVSGNTPKDEEIFLKTFPKIYDFNGDQKIAGGGVWPEPHQFKKSIERRSFFWGRDKNGSLKYYDDYNNPAGKGYHNEEWYVPVRYSKPGSCFWSRSYMDPYSFQPMVTCTVGTFEKEKFTGVATVDLKLEGIETSIKDWQKTTGGYAVLLDRNGKFIAFPEAGDSAKMISSDNEGKRIKEFLTAAEFSKKQLLFQPISNSVAEMNQYILRRAKNSPDFDASLADKIDKDSYQIDREEAEFIAAIITDPLKEMSPQSKLFKTFEIENDFILGEKSLVFLFHVPESYWKLAIVKPVSEATMVATHLVESLIFKLGILIFLLTSMSYFMLRKFLVQPLYDITQSVEKVDTLIGDGKIEEIKNHNIKLFQKGELGALAKVFDTLSKGIVEAHEVIEGQNRELENKVRKRTKTLEFYASELKRSSEKRNQAIIDNVVEAVITIDPKGIIQSFNKGAERSFGYTLEEVIGKNVNVLMPEPFKTEHNDYINNYLTGGKPKVIGITREISCRRKVGSVFPAELSVSEVVLGQERLFTGVIQDITERKRVEGLSARLGRILDNSFNEIYIFDASTMRFIQVSHGARTNLGYSMEELWEMTPYDLKSGYNEETFEALVVPLRLGNKMTLVFEARHQRKDGSSYPVEVRLQLMHGETPPVFVAIIQDISERKNAALKFEESQKILETVLDTIPVRVFWKDKNLDYLGGNSLFTKDAERENIADVVGKDDFALFQKSEAEMYRKDDMEVIRSGKLKIAYEESLTKQDGAQLWVKTSKAPLKDKNGNIIGVIGTYDDITELKEAERDLKESKARLSQLYAHLDSVREEERTRIAREIHDELGQKITALKLDLSWLKKDHLSGNPPSPEKFDSMNNLIGSTLKSVQRICTELRPEVLDVLGLSEAIEWQAREFEKRTGVNFKLHLDNGKIIVDPDRATTVFRIFQETLTNVARHADASEVTVTLEINTSDLIMAVKDNGKGIEESQASHFQSLGLLGMRERAHMWGGEINFQGSQGKGTLVTLTIPR